MDLQTCNDRIKFIKNGSLDQDSPKTVQPKNIKLTLKPHQLTMLYAM